MTELTKLREQQLKVQIIIKKYSDEYSRIGAIINKEMRASTKHEYARMQAIEEIVEELKIAMEVDNG